MSDHQYTRNVLASGAWDINHPDRIDTNGEQIRLASEVKDALPGKVFTLKCTGAMAVFTFVDTLDAGEQTTLDDTVTTHQAGGRVETLDECKVRCITECKEYLGFRMEAPGDVGGALIEYPEDSDKFWSIDFVSQQYWAALEQAKNDLDYPVVRRTWNELDSYSFANFTVIKEIFDIVRVAVLALVDACDAAIDGIVAAEDIAAAETARDTYVGT